MNVNAPTDVGDLFSTAYRAITEERITIKTAKISVDLNDSREKHLTASLLPVHLVNLACIAGNSYIKLHASDLSDVKLKLIDAESMGFPAVLAGPPCFLLLLYFGKVKLVARDISQHELFCTHVHAAVRYLMDTFWEIK